MEKSGDRRRLAAILATDIVGYSLLMGADESGTLARLKTHRSELIDPVIEHNHGRVIKTTGDGMLVEFASVVDAVACAAEIQRRMARRNEDVPQAQRVQYRMGVELGDVIVDGDDIFGDGVNIAARLEAMARPGEINVSAKVYDEVKNRLELDFEDLGERELKNIAQPVRTYRVVLGAPARIRKRGGAWKWVAAAAVVLVAAGYWAWDNSWRFQRVEAASLERMAYPLPERPSVAVLAFDNMTGDPAQDILVDGLSEEIITLLAQIPNLFVIARNSSFTYKGKPVQISQVAEELGVRYVLEGSVRMSGDKVRITTQLIDALNGSHIWTRRYDRRQGDMFELQDDIAWEVAGALEVELTEVEQASLRRKTTSDPAAYRLLLEARQKTGAQKDAIAARRRLLEQAIEKDPEFAAAYADLAQNYWLEDITGQTLSPLPALEEAERLTHRAIDLDADYPGGHVALAHVYRSQDKLDDALASVAQAVRLAPNFAHAKLEQGVLLYLVGRADEAVQLIKEAIRLNPFHSPAYINNLAHAYRVAGQYEDAIKAHEAHKSRVPNSYIPVYNLALTYSLMGRMEDARRYAEEALRLRPNFSVQIFKRAQNYKDERISERFADAMRAAGFPEE